MRIPSRDVWSRETFLRARQAQTKAAYQNQKPNETIIDPNDEIKCDICDILIDTPSIILVRYGRYAICQGCFIRYGYKADPIRYRTLNEDGSLGPEEK